MVEVQFSPLLSQVSVKGKSERATRAGGLGAAEQESCPQQQDSAACRAIGPNAGMGALHPRGHDGGRGGLSQATEAAVPKQGDHGGGTQHQGAGGSARREEGGSDHDAQTLYLSDGSSDNGLSDNGLSENGRSRTRSIAQNKADAATDAKPLHHTGDAIPAGSHSVKTTGQEGSVHGRHGHEPSTDNALRPTRPPGGADASRTPTYRHVLRQPEPRPERSASAVEDPAAGGAADGVGGPSKRGTMARRSRRRFSLPESPLPDQAECPTTPAFPTASPTFAASVSTASCTWTRPASCARSKSPCTCCGTRLPDCGWGASAQKP